MHTYCPKVSQNKLGNKEIDKIQTEDELVSMPPIKDKHKRNRGVPVLAHLRPIACWR